MEKVKIKVEERKGTGKQAVGKLRSKGCVPAVIYGQEVNIPVSISSESFKILKNMHFSESTVIDLTIGGRENSGSIPVFIKDVQFHPLSDEVIHLDLLKVSLKEKIKVPIPIVLKGEPKGKEEGAVLDQVLREIEVEGLPLNIPENIEVDISGLEIGQSIHVEDLNLAGEIEIVTDSEATVAVLAVKKEEEPEEEELEEGAAAEPEVIKEKKDEAAEGKEEGPEPEKSKESQDKG